MSSLTPSSETEESIVLNTLPNEPDLNARLGYEPEGASGCSESCSNDSTLKPSKSSKWSNNLHSLLNCKNGLKSFQRYLEKTNVNHFHMLRFLFACKGLSEESLENAQILIKVIYTRFIAENRIIIEPKLRDHVSEQIDQAAKSGGLLPRDIFKDICALIEQTVNEEMYPNFLAHQALKLQNAKCATRTHHDCKKHFFEHCQQDHCRSAHCHCKATDHAKPPEPEMLAKDLMQRLEKVKLNEESENYKAKEYKHQSAGINSLKGILARVISQKVGDSVEDEDDTENILDDHMNRVWTDDTQDATNTSASHKYLDSRKYVHVPHPYMGSAPVRRKSKDAYSMFSSDSGFGTGYYSDEVSKRTSDYSSYDSDYVPGGRGQHRVNKWGSRQTMTDSGASMMSEDEDKFFRMSCQEKMYGADQAWYNRRRNVMMPTQGHTRDPYKFINEIPSVSMNTLHSIDSYAQLEEQRQCLLRNEMKKILKSPSWGGNSHQSQNCPSVYSKTSSKSQEDSISTTVVYNFSDEKMPYRVRVPGAQITLKDFKKFMPKKGNYRYFFITPCEEFGMRAVQEEVTDDGQVLPLWEGKVDARIKAIK